MRPITAKMSRIVPNIVIHQRINSARKALTKVVLKMLCVITTGMMKPAAKEMTHPMNGMKLRIIPDRNEISKETMVDRIALPKDRSEISAIAAATYKSKEYRMIKKIRASIPDTKIMKPAARNSIVDPFDYQSGLPVENVMLILSPKLFDVIIVKERDRVGFRENH